MKEFRLTQNGVVKDFKTFFSALLKVVIALFSGLFIGFIRDMAGFGILAGGLLTMLSFYSPFLLFGIWFILSPITQGQVINLGAGIPDITIDRALFIFILLGASQKIVRRGYKPSFRSEDISLSIFLAWSIISIIYWRPINLTGQFLALFNQFLLPIGFYWAIQQIIVSEKQIGMVLKLAVIILIMLAIPAIFEEFTGISVLGNASEKVAGVFRVRSFSRSAWEFGTTIGIFFIISIYELIKPSSSLFRKLSLIALPVGGLGIVLSFMRGTWLAVGASIGLIVITIPKLRKRLVLIPIGIGLVLLIWGPLIVQSEVWKVRISNEGNLVGRVSLLQQQYHLWQQEPIFGNGINPSFTSYDTKIVFSIWGSYPISLISHNTFMSTLLDFGLFGLPYFIAIGMIFVKGIRSYRALPSGTLIGKESWLIFCCASMVYFIQAFTYETRLFTNMIALAWICLALTKVIIRLK